MSIECHNVRFYHLEPLPVNCLVYQKNLKLLALSRSDSSIEIWNMKCSPFLERVILGTGGSIEDLAWFGKRLFSVGLQGSVIEYDLFLQSPKSMHPLTSGSSWCISVHESTRKLAAGTEEGFINIFNIESDEIVYDKLMDRQEGRIVCLAWEKSGQFLVSGSADTVRVWNTCSGHAVHKMLTGRSSNNVQTIVSCINVTSNFTIISADSRGKLCFWNGNTGNLISSHQSHKAAIQALVLSDNENILYCAGVDPLVATYEKVKVRNTDDEDKWVKSVQRVLHDHEVKALAVCGPGRLLSAGLDSYLVLSSYPPKRVIKFPPLLQGKCVSVSGARQYVLLRLAESVELWQLGKDRRAAKLLTWKASDMVKTAELAPSGRWLAVGTRARLRLNTISYIDDIPSLQKVNIKDISGDLASNCVAFSGDSKTFVCATVSGPVHVVRLSLDDSPSASLIYSLNLHKTKDLEDMVDKVILSEDGRLLVASDPCSNIVVWSEGEVYFRVPKYKYPSTALAINPLTNELVIVYSNHRIIELNLTEKNFTQFSTQLSENHPEDWLNRLLPVQAIFFDSRNRHVIAFQDDSTIVVLNKKKKFAHRDAKIPRLEGDIDDQTKDDEMENTSDKYCENFAFHVVKKYKHLIYAGIMNEGEIVAVQLNPFFLKDKVPSSFKKNTFGKK